MGTALFAEHEDVLSRAELFATCRLTAAERAELFDIYLAACEWTRVYFAWRPNVPDETTISSSSPWLAVQTSL